MHAFRNGWKFDLFILVPTRGTMYSVGFDIAKLVNPRIPPPLKKCGSLGFHQFGTQDHNLKRTSLHSPPPPTNMELWDFPSFGLRITIKDPPPQKKNKWDFEISPVLNSGSQSRNPHPQTNMGLSDFTSFWTLDHFEPQSWEF